MNYENIYNQLIQKRKDEILDDGYFEKHHIIPKSMGGNNLKDNLINLTAREHFIAHYLLWKIYKNREMGFAFFALSNLRNKNRNIRINSHSYQASKKALSISASEKMQIHNAFKGKKHTAETRKIMSENHYFKNGGEPWNIGVAMSDDTKEKISKSKIGKQLTDDHKLKMSLSLKGRKSEKKGTSISDEHKSKISKGVKETLSCIDIRNKMSESQRLRWDDELRKIKSNSVMGANNPNYGNGDKIRGDKNPNYGVIASEEKRNKISEALKNSPRIKCPHCDKVGSPSNMKRWHFDNCKGINK